MTVELSEAEVLTWAKTLRDYRQNDAVRLDRIYQYLRNPDIADSRRMNAGSGLTNGPLRWLKRGLPDDVNRLAEMARVNFLKFVVDSAVQVMYVDGYRSPTEAEEDDAWKIWQQNRMDARQIGVHRSALSYGAAYVVVLPGDPVAVIRGASPRKMTAVYEDDEEWPELALEEKQAADRKKKLYRLYDSQRTWWVTCDDNDAWSIQSNEEHGVGYVPIVRFLSEINDDGVVEGDVQPLIALQDQINVTTFGLLVAQHYGAFRQRYIMGWAADDEKTAATASAKKLWTFDDPDVKIGEFGQTDLSGYINSREASMRHLATVSQTPAHELLGQMVNLSAEALTAAERSSRNKVEERETSFGESWEQVLELAAELSGNTAPDDAEVRWRDTEARSLSQVADALGKLVTGLGVPPEELWEKIPGVTQQDVIRWKETAAKADAIAQLNATLARQAEPAKGKDAGAIDQGANPQPTPPAAGGTPPAA